MKKKNHKIIWIVLVLILILGGIIYYYVQKNQQDTTSQTANSATIKQVQVSQQDITKTLTGSGEITSSTTENLALDTSLYFSEIYVTENQLVSVGTNILKYTNGTYITAPYDCVITQISVPESSSKCTGQNHIQIQNTDQLYMNLSIDETEISKVAVGQEVKITVNAYEDKTYTGSIIKINEIGNYASNGSSFTAIVQLANDGNIKIGMSASCSVTLEKVENAIAVPIESIQTKGEEKYVIVQQSDGSTKNVTVETGLSNDAYVEIKSGLVGNETIQMVETTSSSKTSGNREMMGGGQPNQNSGKNFSGMPSDFGGSNPRQ